MTVSLIATRWLQATRQWLQSSVCWVLCWHKPVLYSKVDVFINLMVVIFPNPFFEKANGDFSRLLGFSWLAVFIWLPLNVNRMYSGVLSLIFGDQT